MGGPSHFQELTLAVFQPSKLQAQTGSESQQEIARLPALRGYSRTTLGAPGGGVGAQDFAGCMALRVGENDFSICLHH